MSDLKDTQRWVAVLSKVPVSCWALAPWWAGCYRGETPATMGAKRPPT